jgi:hypothetical protein
MLTPEECMAQAVECEAMAARAADSTDKTTMLIMAAQWRKCAAYSAEIQSIRGKLRTEAD